MLSETNSYKYWCSTDTKITLTGTITLTQIDEMFLLINALRAFLKPFV